jgi:hypothetical protein
MTAPAARLSSAVEGRCVIERCALRRFAIVVLLVAGPGACGHDGPTAPGPPVALAARSPASQAGTAGAVAPQAPVVRVTDAAGRGVPGVSVTFAETAGDGSVGQPTRVTNVNGDAIATDWVLGFGPNTLTASAQGLAGSPVTFTATGGPPALQYDGLTGYLTASANGGAPPAGYTYGVSFYSTVSTLQAGPTSGTQLGWGSWIIPDNRTFNQPLCPVGTYARDHWPERGPSYRDVYQTIEGGVGEWVSEMFPTSVPKFRVNGTADCYSHQIASTGWDFGPTALPADQLGLAQLSNRLLTPPDGLVLLGGASATVMGYGWIALPLIPAYTSPLGVPTGDQSWTLFLRAANFTGPVVLYTPEIWSAINAVDATGTGRGEDARPAYNNGVALEIGGTPRYTGRAVNGTEYARIPRMTFATDASGHAPLIGDLQYYSKQAIWDQVAAAIQNGTAPAGFDAGGVFTPSLASPGAGLSLGGDPVTLGAVFGSTVVPSGGGSGALGMTWSGLEEGVLPEYYRHAGSAWVPVSADAVPAETGLEHLTFPPAPRGSFPPLDLTTGTPWDPSHWAAGPFSVALSDGSSVQYVWYRFVDQPAIARLGLADSVRQRLQDFVAAWQAASGTQGMTIAAPSSGTLASLDPALLVSPPAGLEQGYVPIVISQQ